MISFLSGRGPKRWLFYGIPILILIMVFQIWNRPCYLAPFGGQVKSFPLFCNVKKIMGFGVFMNELNQ